MSLLNVPKVSVGLPVYNGARYLADTLDCLLAQTYDDFELIIVDNASTDETQAMCQAYADRDSRIRYYRNDENIGAAANYNRAFDLARGDYFKWSAADDLLEPTFLACCVDVLDQHQDVILAFTRTIAIDDNGNEIKRYPSKSFAADTDPRKRFRTWTLDPHPIVAVFGVIRRDVLARTRLIGKYSGSDRPLLSELSLLGRFYEVPDFLFLYRIHDSQSWGSNKSRHAQQAWYDPARARSMTFPHWRLLAEHSKSISRSPLGFQDRATCYLGLGRWMRKNWRPLYKNLLLQDV